MMKKPDQPGEWLLKLVDDLEINYAFERSFKVSGKTLLGNRFLLAINKTRIAEEKRHRKIIDICRRMGMPDEFLEAFKKNLPEADTVDFGFEENERNSVYKVYLDFLSKWKKEAAGTPGECEPFVMFFGYKWDTHDPAKRALTKYVWYPSISFERINEEFSKIFQGQKHLEPLQITKDLMDMVSKKTTHDLVYYLDVTEENGPRRSFDINIYKAGLQLKQLYPILARTCEHYTIPTETFHALYNPVRTKAFGHLSGGISRDGKDFLTVYYGLEENVKNQ
jgi:hypothetical protein